MATIKSGDSGDVAKVDSDKRLQTKALSVGVPLESTLLGNSFCISSGIITITNATTNALLYFVSCECVDTVLTSLFLDFGDTTCATDTSGVVTFHHGPTGGTLISDACAATIINERIGDSQTLCGSAFKASAVSKTLTGGNAVTFPLVGDSFGVEFQEGIVIPKAKAFGISWQPPAGNTSQPVEIGFRILRNISTTAR